MKQFLTKLRGGEEVTLSALGDSLTHGYLVPFGYLDMVETKLREDSPGNRLSVLNHGLCGDTVFGGNSRAAKAFYQPQPDLGFIEFGLNDCFQGMPASQFEGSLRHLLEGCQARVPHMALLLLPPIPVKPPDFELLAEPFRAAYHKLGEEFSVPVIDFATPWHQAHPTIPLWQGDGVHPTEAGYRVMADAVLEVILMD
jgi:acyl-CoA thioesterase I